MPSTILFISDMHKRDTDFTTIRGYTKAGVAVQDDLLETIKELSVDKLVIAGDWYDKGYRSISRVFNDAFYYDRKISEAVHGEVYLCLGNHLFLERDSNPEMYIIQPNARYIPQDPIRADTPIFQATDGFRVGDLQVSLFHFDKMNKNYHREREPGVKFHIGVYHDDCVLPSDIRSASGYFGNTSSTYLNDIYAGVDLAYVGHIHTKLGMQHYTLMDGRQLPIYVPGAQCITENKDIVKHRDVDLLLVTVEDDGGIKLGFVKQSTHMEMLQFYAKRETVLNVSDEKANGAITQEITELGSTMSARQYLRDKGFGDNYIKLYDQIGNGLMLTQVIELVGGIESGRCRTITERSEG